MFYSREKSILRKNSVFAIEKFASLLLSGNAVMFERFIQFPLYFLSSGRLREVKNKRKFQTFSFKRGSKYGDLT